MIKPDADRGEDKIHSSDGNTTTTTISTMMIREVDSDNERQITPGRDHDFTIRDGRWNGPTSGLLMLMPMFQTALMHLREVLEGWPVDTDRRSSLGIHFTRHQTLNKNGKLYQKKNSCLPVQHSLRSKL